MDGIDLTPVLDGTLTNRPTPLYFWAYNTRANAKANREPYVEPKLQEGTTPLVKKMGAKATRDFTNFKHPTVTAQDHLGARSIIEGDHKLIIHEQKDGTAKIELFDLKADPAEKTNLASQQPEIVKKLQTQLRQWQDSVLKSLTAADY
jgi:hypothetical protein